VTRPNLFDDDVLATLLIESLVEADPVPGDAVSVAKALARLSDADAELATLVADSLVDDVVLFRHDVTMEAQGESADRLVTFATPRLSVDIDLQAGRGTVVGAITPAISVDVDLETTKGTQTTRSDELGRFQIEAGGNLCRLRIHALGGAVVTPWINR
jgi:hypothetical protein